MCIGVDIGTSYKLAPALEYPEWLASMAISLFVSMNFYAVVNLLTSFDVKILLHISETPLTILISYLLLSIFNYFYFIRDDRFLYIVKKFESKNYGLIGSLSVAFYVAATFVLIVMSANVAS